MGLWVYYRPGAMSSVAPGHDHRGNTVDTTMNSLKMELADKLPERCDFGSDVYMEVILDQRIGIH